MPHPPPNPTARQDMHGSRGCSGCCRGQAAGSHGAAAGDLQGAVRVSDVCEMWLVKELTMPCHTKLGGKWVLALEHIAACCMKGFPTLAGTRAHAPFPWTPTVHAASRRSMRPPLRCWRGVRRGWRPSTPPWKPPRCRPPRRRPRRRPPRPGGPRPRPGRRVHSVSWTPWPSGSPPCVARAPSWRPPAPTRRRPCGASWRRSLPPPSSRLGLGWLLWGGGA